MLIFLPNLSVLITEFWQNTHLSTQPEKKIVPLPLLPLIQGSSHKWRSALATKGSDGKYYDNFHAISKDGREAINGYILDAYEQKLAEEQGEDQDSEQGETAEEDQEIGPSM